VSADLRFGHTLEPRPSTLDVAIAARAARPSDAADIAEIYNEGIADRIATFETRPRTPDEIAAWFDGRHPIVVVEGGADSAGVLGFGATSTYRARECYAGIAEFSVYVRRAARGHGVGRVAMLALIDAAERLGYWKLVSRVIAENVASRRLLGSVGFREVGVYRRHARLDGRWRDAVIVERLLGDAAADDDERAD
jgi:phosphinothricin acetyltransferase